jgi:hypothetical protein
LFSRPLEFLFLLFWHVKTFYFGNLDLIFFFLTNFLLFFLFFSFFLFLFFPDSLLFELI